MIRIREKEKIQMKRHLKKYKFYGLISVIVCPWKRNWTSTFLQEFRFSMNITCKYKLSNMHHAFVDWMHTFLIRNVTHCTNKNKLVNQMPSHWVCSSSCFRCAFKHEVSWPTNWELAALDYDNGIYESKKFRLQSFAMRLFCQCVKLDAICIPCVLSSIVSPFCLQ